MNNVFTLHVISEVLRCESAELTYSGLHVMYDSAKMLPNASGTMSGQLMTTRPALSFSNDSKHGSQISIPVLALLSLPRLAATSVRPGECAVVVEAENGVSRGLRYQIVPVRYAPLRVRARVGPLERRRRARALQQS